MKGECTFLVLNFLIVPLFNSSANSLLEIISFLILDLFASVSTPPEPFLSFYEKIYKPLEQDRVDIHHILEF